MPCSAVAVMFCPKGSIGSKWFPPLRVRMDIKGDANLSYSIEKAIEQAVQSRGLAPMPIDMHRILVRLIAMLVSRQEY